MKKPKGQLEDTQPGNIQCADITPSDGCDLAVDGHFKTHFAERAAAEKVATGLLTKYPMLQIEIYDASSRSQPWLSSNNLVLPKR
jgi:hypothetical protein